MEIAAVIFVLIVLGIAFIAFRVLKKTVKLAFRLMLVFVLLLAAATGAVALLFFGGNLPGQ
ncbi:MAG: hypothetical protein DWQ47_07795 [Acidobacteria bacterium]|nr:MAG: hypothetical protein DWQ32_15895 [Acidobacteriota bacterium]REJ99179.1 MAG: hypothetical protein DWQ38_14080 [Acidobacteriota bacterium]REK16100.1 MAG: hypothetical protein DWQ43_03605 [Acidobacteriota bacterium]REK43781.1 MAG: hypothetical protein DWQ47_07795 [Acidobacteriota bacterium]